MENLNETLFVEVILPLHLPATFTYRVPREYSDDIKIGVRVAVQFGGKRIYSALVAQIHNQIPKIKNIKYILAILDDEPVVSEKNMAFWQWVATYYCSYIGDVITAALPAAFRLKSETKIIVSSEFEGDISHLDTKEQQILSALSQNESLTIEQTAKATAMEENILPIIQTLIRKKVLTTDEELYDKYKPKKEAFISLASKYRNDLSLKNLFAELAANKKYEKQEQAILTYFALQPKNNNWDVRKADMINRGVSVNTLNTLIKKEIAFSRMKVASRLFSNPATLNLNELILTDEQNAAFESIIHQPEGKVSLLHGVTSSGKTEVYVKLIEKTLAENRQILFLLPEISLTAQLIQRLEKYFGGRVGVYHSRFSREERVEIWKKVRSTSNERYSIIIGSRSAIFLPFTDLGLVIVDEEHDNSFKQLEPSPRYNGRDVALWLAAQHRARAVLGSATPSVETYYYAQIEKYNLCTLKHRFSSVPLPEILIADTKEARKNGEMYSIFSKLLLDNIAIALKNKEQVILFQNRRGFAPIVQCDVCAHIPKCPNCDVSLTLHKRSASMNCHYCDNNSPLLKVCPQCGSGSLKMIGFGTEKIEEELAIYFPQAQIERMDLDVAKGSKDAYNRMISAFEKRETDILIGTQMISKGLDFDNVSLVGIMNADSLIAIPDFRSYERAFQMMTQVSGRSGRRQKGKVVIQTANAYHQVIRDVSEHNYLSMFNSQILERKVFRYPPFYRIVKIVISHQDEQLLERSATDYAQELRKIFSTERILGPQSPLVGRIRNRYITQLWIKLESKLSYSAAKIEIMRLNESFLAMDSNKSIRLVVDIDPQ